MSIRYVPHSDGYRVYDEADRLIGTILPRSYEVYAPAGLLQPRGKWIFNAHTLEQAKDGLLAYDKEQREQVTQDGLL